MSDAEEVTQTVHAQEEDLTPIDDGLITIEDEVDTDGELEKKESIEDKQEIQNESKPQPVKKFSKKKKSSSVGKRYPTQYMKVGEIHCIFFSCYYRGRSPLIALGPSWPFTSVLLLLAGLISFYFYMMLSMAGDKANPWHKLWCHACIALNLFLLFAGILKNPGIPQHYLDRILKEQQGKGEDALSSGSDIEM